jgi:hypothetical protein
MARIDHRGPAESVATVVVPAPGPRAGNNHPHQVGQNVVSTLRKNVGLFVYAFVMRTVCFANGAFTPVYG